ncbi:uncharacterized protein EI90DRAFT_3115365 [Cantharellus anzutake]|uniref:uncharacterized protein n=1 Tax=Cantharellus anzutake TaxID=1750568 RepID=UPI0019075DF6|nr:uncharacterized protein EI90DRAFT_3115365 [Cantharellus anzutake]KAF8342831.1 hypothetical protein EI90DRAFT_3115365 [Cantharellus anzutake]
MAIPRAINMHGFPYSLLSISAILTFLYHWRGMLQVTIDVGSAILGIIVKIVDNHSRSPPSNRSLGKSSGGDLVNPTNLLYPSIRPSLDSSGGGQFHFNAFGPAVEKYPSAPVRFSWWEPTRDLQVYRIYCKMSRHIDVVQGDIPYSEFLGSYLIPNKPCILTQSLTEGWPCYLSWTHPSGDVSSESRPAWQYFAQIYGRQEVTVADCRTRDFSDQKRLNTTVAEAIHHFQPSTDSDQERPLYYIKDWHIVRQSGRDKTMNLRDREPYFTPSIFLDDWLNGESLRGKATADDFMFCYAGVAGTFTPLHADVYSSYSWSTNIVGRKLWRLFSPSITHCLRKDPENRRSERIFDVRSVDLACFPQWSQAERQMIIVEQFPGETIFIPSVNLPSMYEAMRNEVEDVSWAISDVKLVIRDSHARDAVGKHTAEGWEVEWLRQVDKLVRMDSGWGWIHFFEMIANSIDVDLVHTPVHLRPPTAFVVSRVGPILEDFRTREEYLYLPEVRIVADHVQSLLSRIRGD